MLSVEEAQKIILSKIAPLEEIEEISLGESIGRTLAKDVLAPFDQPPFSNSAMDGFAVRSEDLKAASFQHPISLEVKKFQSAGSSFCELEQRSAFEIATGAPLPMGADTVVVKEEVQYQHERATFKRAVLKGENVRRQGEDLVCGTPLFLKGEKVREKNSGLLASFGLTQLEVFLKPRVVYFATGDEIVSPGSDRLEHQIYNSNALVLSALFRKEGCSFQNLGMAKDTPEMTVEFLRRATEMNPHIIVLTGGVSVGKHDFVKESLSQSGAEIIFHKVCVKPGKPLLLAKKNNILIFALPGNPLAAQVGFYQFIYPAIRKLLFSKDYFLDQEEAFLQSSVKQENRHLFLIGIKQIIQGKNVVIPLKQGSGNVASFSLGNCFVSIPPGEGQFNQNDSVMVQPYV